MAAWTVYILECADGTLYTGIATNLDRRIAAHAAGRGARYTRGRGPFVLRHAETVETRSDATKREAAIKALDAAGKRRLAGLPGPAAGNGAPKPAAAGTGRVASAE